MKARDADVKDILGDPSQLLVVPLLQHFLLGDKGIFETMAVNHHQSNRVKLKRVPLRRILILLMSAKFSPIHFLYYIILCIKI